MPERNLPSSSRFFRRGQVLVISLIVLLLLTIIGVTAMRTTTLQERMAGNLRDQTLAFQAAESGLRDAEQWLDDQVTEPVPVSPPCPSGQTCHVYEADSLTDLLSRDPAWWEANGIEYGTEGSTDIAGVAADPRYVTESEAFIRDSLRIGHEVATGRNVYRSTARATGGSANAVRTVQGTYVRRFN